MAQVHLWKFPKQIIPQLKEEYLKENWLFLIQQFNYYLIGENLCPVCPDSVNKIKQYLRPLFLADIEVMYREGKQAGQKELCELYAKYVSSESDICLVKQIPERYLRATIAIFANADLKARAVSQQRRLKLLSSVLKVSRQKFSAQFCDMC